jgi:hypothetical protein
MAAKVYQRTFFVAGADTVLIKNSHNDQSKGTESHQIKKWLLLRPDSRQTQYDPIKCLNKKRNRKEQKKAVMGLCPKPQEEQRRH